VYHQKESLKFQKIRENKKFQKIDDSQKFPIFSSLLFSTRFKIKINNKTTRSKTMGVSASLEGIQKMREVMAERGLQIKNNTKMTIDLNMDMKTIKKFFDGLEVHRNTAEAITNYLNLRLEDILIPPPPLIPDLDFLWQKLSQLATYAPRQLGVISSTVPTLAFDDEAEEQFLTRIISKSPVKIKIKPEQPGYLILLDRDSTGEVVCLSPSPYVPQPQLHTAEWEELPQAALSSKKVFKPATLGEEVFLAILFSEKPEFSWLTVLHIEKSVGERCLRLQGEQLQELCQYIEQVKPVQLLSTKITIVAA